MPLPHGHGSLRPTFLPTIRCWTGCLLWGLVVKGVFLTDSVTNQQFPILSKEEIKSIIAEHGRFIKTETDKIENKYKDDIDTYKTTIDDLKEQISRIIRDEFFGKDEFELVDIAFYGIKNLF